MIFIRFEYRFYLSPIPKSQQAILYSETTHDMVAHQKRSLCFIDTHTTIIFYQITSLFDRYPQKNEGFTCCCLMYKMLVEVTLSFEELASCMFPLLLRRFFNGELILTLNKVTP